MTPKERAMSEQPQTIDDVWGGVPDSWREALRAYACAEATMPEWREARIKFAALLREAAADQGEVSRLRERVKELEGVVEEIMGEQGFDKEETP